MPEPPPVITTILPFAVALFSSFSGCSSSGTLRWIVFVNWNGRVKANAGSVRSVLMVAVECLLIKLRRDFCWTVDYAFRCKEGAGKYSLEQEYTIMTRRGDLYTLRSPVMCIGPLQAKPICQ
jgi:hypothetical protein